jgi:hypothetical protein
MGLPGRIVIGLEKLDTDTSIQTFNALVNQMPRHFNNVIQMDPNLVQTPDLENIFNICYKKFIWSIRNLRVIKQEHKKHIFV